jgi:hypothetical protein
MPTATARTAPQQGEILAESGEFLDWDGNEVERLEQTYDEYVNSRPSPEELRRYRTPIYYWEVKAPGCALQPYPQMGAFSSSEDGLWAARNPSQNTAIRHRLASIGIDPDEMKLSADELAVMQGKAKGSIRFCEDCGFTSCSARAVELHEALRGHTTKSQAQLRKDG